MKVCTLCKVAKSIDSFGRDKTKSDGRNPRCKSCKKIYTDAHKEESAKYRSDNREILAANQRQRRVQNPEYDKQRYLANKDAYRASEQRWASLNRDKVRSSKANRRALQRKAVSNLPRNFWVVLLNFYPVCQKCGTNKNLQHDHIVPLNKGGHHTWLNSQVLCKSCNSAKRDRSSADYRDWTGGVIYDVYEDQLITVSKFVV